MADTVPCFRRMAFDLNIEGDWPPVAVETLWAKAAVDGRLLHFSGKVEGGEHSTIHVIMTAAEAGPAVKADIAEAGCRTEVSPWPSLFSIDVPSRGLLVNVHRILDARAAAGELEYVNACLAGTQDK